MAKHKQHKINKQSLKNQKQDFKNQIHFPKQNSKTTMIHKNNEIHEEIDSKQQTPHKLPATTKHQMKMQLQFLHTYH